MIQTEADAAAAMDEIGALWEAVDEDRVPPVQAAQDIVARATAVTEFYLAAGKRGTLYEIVVKPQADWAFYTFAAKSLKLGVTDSPEGRAHKEACDMVLEYHGRYQYLEDQADESPVAEVSAESADDSAAADVARAKYEKYLHAALEQLVPGQWGAILPGSSSWSANGTIFVYSQSVAKTRVGILAQLTLTPELVAFVGDTNRTCVHGAFWLVEGQTGNWQLVWGTKMPWEYFQSDKFMADYIVQLAQAGPVLRSGFEEKFQERFGGRPWWLDDADPGAQALTLLAVSC